MKKNKKILFLLTFLCHHHCHTMDFCKNCEKKFCKKLKTVFPPKQSGIVLCDINGKRHFFPLPKPKSGRNRIFLNPKNLIYLMSKIPKKENWIEHKNTLNLIMPSTNINQTKTINENWQPRTATNDEIPEFNWEKLLNF